MDPRNAQSITTSGAEFAFNFYKHVALRKSPPDNMVVSTLSIAMALAMTSAGARGKSLEEIVACLTFDDSEQMHRFFLSVKTEVLKNLAGDEGGPTLLLANGVWVDRSVGLKQSFKDRVEKHYGADAREADFTNKPEEERSTINAWISEHTNGKIEDMLAEGSVDRDTVLMLANALYYKGTWKHKFDPENTKEGDFHLLDGTTVQVPFMSNRRKLFIESFDKYKLLKLSYLQAAKLRPRYYLDHDEHKAFVTGEDWTQREVDYDIARNVTEVGQREPSFAMYFVLPHAQDGLEALEKTLDVQSLASQFRSLGKHEASEVRIPSFKIKAQLELKEILEGMGVRAAFDQSEADFGDMAEGGNLRVGAVFHSCAIDVNEEGTEAAAATVMKILPMSLRFYPPPIDFIADHPFLFFLVEEKTGLVWFVGRVIDPR